MEVTQAQFHDHIRENDAAFADLRTDVQVLKATLTEVRDDVKLLLRPSAKGNNNPGKGDQNQRLQYDLIRLLVGALIALAGVGAQRLIGG